MDRSTDSISLDDFKLTWRQFLRDLKATAGDDALQKIDRLEWCLDAWNELRLKFFADAPQPFTFPFLLCYSNGREFAHYDPDCNAFGAPSTIAVAPRVLTKGEPFVIATIPANALVDHDRDLVIDPAHPGFAKWLMQVLLHELCHQHLHEGAEPAVVAQYADNESGKSGHRGHGQLFAAECNRIAALLHPQLGLDVVPVRPSKKGCAGALRRRPSCAHWGTDDLFFAWDPRLGKELTEDEAADNERRIQQGLKVFGGAITLVDNDPPANFSVPYDGRAALEKVLAKLTDRDAKQKTTLVKDFWAAADAARGMAPDAADGDTDDTDDEPERFTVESRTAVTQITVTATKEDGSPAFPEPEPQPAATKPKLVLKTKLFD